MFYYVCDTSTSHLRRKKFDQEVRGGSGKVKICLELAKFAFRVLWRPLNGSRVPEIDSNLSWAVEGTIWGPFQDYLNHSGPLEDSEAMSGADFDVPFPPLQTWSRFCGSKCVRHIVLLFMFNSHLLGHFRPSKESWTFYHLGGQFS